jgi:outer membrane protein assembly factor BamA
VEVTDTRKINIQKRSMLAHILIDKSDHPLYPRKGNTYSLILNKTGGILGGNRDFFKMDLGLTGYSSMREIVFAGQVKIGKIYGWSSNYRDYQYDLFYLGGSTSLRGWDMLRFNVDENKNPKGNITRIMANAEIRFPLFWILGGEVFIDGGYLADSFSKFSLSHLVWDAGVGITLITALGPVRLDFAAPVDDFKYFRKWKIQLGVHYLF